MKTSAVSGGIFNSLENKVVQITTELQRLQQPVRGNTLIISRMNTPQLVGSNAYVENDLDNVFLPDRLWAATANPGNSMRFIASLLGSDDGRAALSELASGTSGSMKNIAKSDLLKLRIDIPTLPEQTRIADCLSSIDSLIAAQTQKLEALRSHKRGLMQQLFPAEGESVPKLRFPEFEGAREWEERKLGRTGEIVTGSTPSTTQPENYGGAKLFVSPADMSEQRHVEKTKTTLTDVGFTKVRRIRPDSVLFVCIGSTIGKVAQNLHECATNQQINSIMPNEYNYASFLYSILENNSEKIAKLAGRQAVPIINKTIFSEVQLFFPLLPEQIRIADCLSSLDTLIAAQGDKIAELKAFKRGLMQQLFPAPEDMQE